MPDTDVATTKPEGERYVEDPDFVPDPTHQFGTLDTSGTAGAAHARIEEVTPIFDVADQENAKQAARALDPNDKEVPSSLVVIDQGQRMHVADEESVKRRIEERAATAKPVRIFGPTMAQKQAAESGVEGAETAQSQQENQAGSAGGSASGDPDGTERQTGEGATGTADTSDTGGSPEAPVVDKDDKPKPGGRGR
jgi:hypothetical protein